jgi:hypothetical protein
MSTYSYEMIDRYLRNNLGDDDYAEYSEALDDVVGSSKSDEFIRVPVAYQYEYADGYWRCNFGEEVNGMKPKASRALYARKDGK